MLSFSSYKNECMMSIRKLESIMLQALVQTLKSGTDKIVKDGGKPTESNQCSERPSTCRIPKNGE